MDIFTKGVKVENRRCQWMKKGGAVATYDQLRMGLRTFNFTERGAEN